MSRKTLTLDAAHLKKVVNTHGIHYAFCQDPYCKAPVLHAGDDIVVIKNSGKGTIYSCKRYHRKCARFLNII